MFRATTASPDGSTSTTLQHTSKVRGKALSSGESQVWIRTTSISTYQSKYSRPLPGTAMSNPVNSPTHVRLGRASSEDAGTSRMSAAQEMPRPAKSETLPSINPVFDACVNMNSLRQKPSVPPHYHVTLHFPRSYPPVDPRNGSRAGEHGIPMPWVACNEQRFATTLLPRCQNFPSLDSAALHNTSRRPGVAKLLLQLLVVLLRVFALLVLAVPEAGVDLHLP